MSDLFFFPYHTIAQWHREINTKRFNNTMRDEDAIKNARRETDGTQQMSGCYHDLS